MYTGAGSLVESTEVCPILGVFRYTLRLCRAGSNRRGRYTTGETTCDFAPCAVSTGHSCHSVEKSSVKGSSTPAQSAGIIVMSGTVGARKQQLSSGRESWAVGFSSPPVWLASAIGGSRPVVPGALYGGPVPPPSRVQSPLWLPNDGYRHPTSWPTLRDKPAGRVALSIPFA